MADSYTIKEFIEEEQDNDITYKKLHLLENILLPKESDYSLFLSDAITNRYRKDFDNLIYEKTLTAEERSKYYYNPRMLCYEEYGTTELWHLILDINAMYSVTEFNRPTIKLFDKSITNVISSILALEEQAIAINEDEINGNTTTYQQTLAVTTKTM